MTHTLTAHQLQSPALDTSCEHCFCSPFLLLLLLFPLFLSLVHPAGLASPHMVTVALFSIALYLLGRSGSWRRGNPTFLLLSALLWLVPVPLDASFSSREVRLPASLSIGLCCFP